MIFASFIDDAAMFLAVIGALFMLVVIAAAKAATGAASAAAKASRSPGKRNELAAKAGSTLLGAVLKRLFLGKWR
jgi:hypothetical protein